MKDMMKNCMQRCSWCPLFPISLGIIGFMAGYFLDAEIIRILWLILSGAIVIMGLLCWLMMKVFSSR